MCQRMTLVLFVAVAELLLLVVAVAELLLLRHVFAVVA